MDRPAGIETTAARESFRPAHALRVLVYEPDSDGHHLDFVRLMLPAVRQLASHVVIGTSQRAVASEEYRVLIAPALGPNLHVGQGASVEIDSGVYSPFTGDARADGRSSLLAKSLVRAEQFVDCVKRTRPDHVIVPYADGLSQALVLRRFMLRRGIANDPVSAAVGTGITSDVLFMRGAVAYPSATFRQALAVRASWRLMEWAPHNHVFHLDPLVFDWVARHHPRLISREPGQGGWSLLPDPTPAFAPLTRAEARIRIGIPTDGLIVGAVGVMDARKGIDLLLRAFNGATLPPDTRLLLVGKQAPVIREMLDRRGEAGEAVRMGRIIAVDRFVDVNELGWTLQAMDLVVASHKRHVGSASIVIKAAAANRPVLGADFGWIDATVRRYGLGSTCRVEDTATFSAALERALPAAHLWRLGEAGRRFVSFHSEQNFQNAWCAFMRHRMGLPQAASTIEWSWVEQAVERW